MIEAPREMPQNAVHLSPRWAIPCGVLAAALQSHALKTLSTKTMEKLVTYQKRILLKGRSELEAASVKKPQMMYKICHDVTV